MNPDFQVLLCCQNTIIFADIIQSCATILITASASAWFGYKYSYSCYFYRMASPLPDNSSVDGATLQSLKSFFEKKFQEQAAEIAKLKQNASQSSSTLDPVSGPGNLQVLSNIERLLERSIEGDAQYSEDDEADADEVDGVPTPEDEFNESLRTSLAHESATDDNDDATTLAIPESMLPAITNWFCTVHAGSRIQETFVTGWGVGHFFACNWPAIAKTTLIPSFPTPQHFPAQSAHSDHAHHPNARPISKRASHALFRQTNQQIAWCFQPINIWHVRLYSCAPTPSSTEVTNGSILMGLVLNWDSVSI